MTGGPTVPARHPELSRRAGLRDVGLGAVILAVGLATGASTAFGDPEAVDLLADGFGVALLVWGLARVARASVGRRGT